MTKAEEESVALLNPLIVTSAETGTISNGFADIN
jgi:hypothetical protein